MPAGVEAGHADLAKVAAGPGEGAQDHAEHNPADE
jgi:hypothetical protein